MTTQTKSAVDTGRVETATHKIEAYILAALADGYPLTSNQLARALKITPNRARTALHRAWNQGLCQRVKSRAHRPTRGCREFEYVALKDRRTVDTIAPPSPPPTIIDVSMGLWSNDGSSIAVVFAPGGKIQDFAIRPSSVEAVGSVIMQLLNFTTKV